MKRRVHGGNLTSKKETSYSSTLRKYNNDYTKGLKDFLKSRADGVVVMFTNSFTEITNPDTKYVPSKEPFPKLDVIYQEKLEWKLTQGRDTRKEKPQAVTHAVYGPQSYDGAVEKKKNLP